MAKSKPKVKRGISKSRKPVRASPKAKKKPSKEALPAISEEKPPKEVKDLLPPPPPGYFRKKEFSPSLHGLSRIISGLRKDIHYILGYEKFLYTPEDRLLIMPDKDILKALDVLKDEKRYVEELEDIEKKVASYEKLPKKGWLLDKRVKEASTLLQAYKQGAAEKREKIIRHLTSIRKQKEMIVRQRRQGEEQTKKEEIIKSLEEPIIKPKPPKKLKAKPAKKGFFIFAKKKIAPKIEPKPPKKLKAKPAKKGFFTFMKKKAAKPEKELKKIAEIRKPEAKALPAEPKKEAKAKEPEVHALPAAKVSQHELRKHVFQLKESLEHISKSHGLFKKLDEKLHAFSHKELHGALDKLRAAKEHVEKIGDIEEHIAAHASVPHGKRTKGKLEIAEKLLDKHKIDVRKTKNIIAEKINSVKKRISALEKEHKKAKEKKEKLEEETSKFLPKLSELKKHLRYVAGNKKLLELPEDKLSALSSSKLYDISNKLNIIKQYIGEIEDIEEHLAAESSKPKALTAERRLEDARRLIDSYKIDIKKDRSLISKKVGLIKRLAKEAEKKIEKPREAMPKPPLKLPKLKAVKEKPEKPKPEVKEKLPKKEKLEKPGVELEVPKPRFERPDPELVKLTYHLKKNLKCALKNEEPLQTSDDMLRSFSSWKLNRVTKRLNILKQCLDDIEHAEEHIAAESSIPKGLTAEKQLEDAKKLIDSFGIDISKKLKDVNAKLKFIQEEIKQPERPPEAVEKPKIEEPKEKLGLKPEKLKPKEPEVEEPVKEIAEPKLEVPPPPKVKLREGVPSKELAMRIYRLKRALDYVAGNEKPLQISDEALQSLASWRLKGIAKKLALLKQRLDEIEDIEEHIAAESSVSKGPAIEKQLEKAKEVMGSFDIDAAKKLKEVKARIDFIKSLRPGMVKEEVPKEKPKPEISAPELGKPEPELAKLSSRLKVALANVTKNQKILELSDEDLTALAPRKLRKIAGKLNLLKQYLDELEDIEEHIAAKSSVSKAPAVEKQLENLKRVIDASNIDPAKRLKEVKAKLGLIQKPAELPEEIPEPEKPRIEEPVKEKEIEPKLAIPPPLKLGKPKPELAKLSAELKKSLNFIAKNEKLLQIPDDELSSFSSWKLGGVTKKLNLIKQALDKVEEIEEHIAAESSVSQEPAVEAQLENAKKIMESYGIDPAKKLKVVSGKLDLVQVKPPEEAPELEAEKPEIEMPPPPGNKEAEELPKRRYQVLMEKISKKKELPPPPVEKPAEKPVKEPKIEPGVPVFKPSPAELYSLISKIKRDLNYIAAHEELLHIPDEKVISLSHKRFDKILEQLKTEEKYLDNLEEIEKRIEQYEGIPNKGWLSGKKIDEARRLLEAYKSTDVSMTRKMLMSRLKLMREQKKVFEGEAEEKRKGITEALAERGLKLGEEAKTLKEVETHVRLHEKKTAEELAADLKSLKLAKGVGKPAEVPSRKVIKFKPPKLEKPILEKEEVEARKEITEAIGAIKTGKPVMKNKIEYIMAQIDEARKALESLDVETAKSIYVDIHTVYMGMKPLEQYHVYEALKDLYEERKQAEKLVS
ncbi:hypothetical protein KY361_05340 [Candidatus Woesearchaeota archaeon]|nr:hypothetical protein [Candidatus Woesearchaeota archaeon]